MIELLSKADLLKKSGLPFWSEVVKDLSDTSWIARGLGVIDQVG